MEQKKALVLLHGAIENDSRVIKTITSLKKLFLVDVYCALNDKKSNDLFIEDVSIIRFEVPKNKFLKNSFFVFEYDFLGEYAIKSNNKYDLVWANDLPTLHSAIIIKKKMNSYLIYDSHEIYSETINQFFNLSRFQFPKKQLFIVLIQIMRVIGVYFEKRYLKHVDIMITVNESLKNYFINKYNYNNIQVVYNCPNTFNYESEIVKKINIFEKYGWTKTDIIFLYQGAFNRGRGLELLIEAFLNVKKNAKLLLIGNGILDKKISEKIIALGLQEQVKIDALKPLNELKYYTMAADWGINLLESFNLSKSLASPNKLFEYLHAQIPIISSPTTENINLFKQYQYGKILENNYPNTIANVINSINKDDHKEYINSIKEAKKMYNWENEEQKIMSIINTVIVN